MYLPHSLFSAFSSDIVEKGKKYDSSALKDYCSSKIATLRADTKLRCNSLDAILQLLLTPEAARPPTIITDSSLIQETLYQ